jgi:hypothetical protein
MKLSLALLSILQNKSAVSQSNDGSGDTDSSHDIYEISHCSTVFVSTAPLINKPVTSLNALRVDIEAQLQLDDIVDDNGASIDVTGLFATCSGNGNGAEGEYDQNTVAYTMSQNVINYFDGLDAVDASVDSTANSCFDICLKISGDESQLNPTSSSTRAISNLTSSHISKYIPDLEDMVQEAVNGAIGATQAAAVTTLNAEHEVTLAEGSG